MKEKGFTLIELLAVIVILAIIALIATPVILNIIDDAREESNKRSIDNYAKAVENAVARYQLKNGIGISGSFNLSENENEKRTLVNDEGKKLEIEYDGADVECGIIEISTEGKIYLASCTVDGNIVDYVYGASKYACTLNDKDSSGDATLSDEITCGTESFYVMSTDNTANTVTMLAKYNLEVGYDWNNTTWQPVSIQNPSGIQSENVGCVETKESGWCLKHHAVIDFSEYPYWDYENQDANGNYGGYYGGYYDESTYEGYYVGYYSPAGDSNYSYVYDEHSNLYPYVEAYEDYLQANGVSSAEATLMSYEQAISLGCDNSTSWYGRISCGNAPSWVSSTTYWLGSQKDNLFLVGIGFYSSDPIFGSIWESGVRPVVTVNDSQVRMAK